MRLFPTSCVHFFASAGFAWLAAQNVTGVPEAETTAGEESPSLSARLETAEGETLEGPLAVEEDEFVIRSAAGKTLRAPVDDLARLEVTAGGSAPASVKESSLPAGALPSPWRSKDVGRTVLPGKTRWRDGQFVISSAPKVDGHRFDSFHMVYRALSGDGEIVARVVSLDNRDEDSYAGIVMCDGLTPENRKAVLGVRPYGERGVNFRRWGYQGGSSTGKDIPLLELPYWVKLVREGYDVSAYYSPDGRRWRFLKESVGKMRDEQIYVGLAVKVQKFQRLSETIIDHVSVNGEGSKEAEPLLPHVVLRAGSTIASRIARADRSAFICGGDLKGRAVTVPQVARVEFFHPLPEEFQEAISGSRSGLLLRSGDFAEGDFLGLEGNTISFGSVLFGSKDYSVLDDVDALVFRKVAEEPFAFEVETEAGSVFKAQEAALQNEELVLQVAGAGEITLALSEIREIRRAPGDRQD